MKKKLLLSVVFLFSFMVNSQTPIQEFNFDGSLSNTKNDISFSGNAKFVNDREGVANKAIRLINSTIEVTAFNLPVSNSSRTVSIWVKYNKLATANYIWGYGSSYNARYFGLLQQSTTNTKSDLNLAGYGPGNDLIVTTTIASNIWYNYIVTYDGLTSKIYRDGVLIKSSESPRKLTSGIVFSIGKMGKSVSIDADIDDLQIYDVALSGEEVLGLYNRSLVKINNVASKDSAKTSVKKRITKPVSDKKPVSVKAEMTVSSPVEITVNKSSEIYSIHGQKVFSGTNNHIDISNIPEGSYLLQVKKSNQTEKAITLN